MRIFSNRNLRFSKCFQVYAFLKCNCPPHTCCMSLSVVGCCCCLVCVLVCLPVAACKLRRMRVLTSWRVCYIPTHTYSCAFMRVYVNVCSCNLCINALSWRCLQARPHFFFTSRHTATCIFVPTRVCVIVHLNDVVSYRTHNKSPNVISSQIFQRYIAQLILIPFYLIFVQSQQRHSSAAFRVNRLCRLVKCRCV